MTLVQLFDKSVKDFENHPNLDNTVKMGIMLFFWKHIKRDIERGNYSFWMSCTAP